MIKHPPLALLQHDPEAYGVLPVAVLSYHKFFGSGVGTSPPCPVHGWEAAEQGMVTQKTFTEADRALLVHGVSDSYYIIGTRHECKLCANERAQRKGGDAAGDDGSEMTEGTGSSFYSYDRRIIR
jgi:hypothetical protein